MALDDRSVFIEGDNLSKLVDVYWTMNQTNAMHEHIDSMHDWFQSMLITVQIKYHIEYVSLTNQENTLIEKVWLI